MVPAQGACDHHLLWLGSTVSVPGLIESWKAISEALGRCQRSCRQLAAREDDPLPVFKIGGVVALKTNDLAAWIDRQQRKPMRAKGQSTEYGVNWRGMSAIALVSRTKMAEILTLWWRAKHPEDGDVVATIAIDGRARIYKRSGS